VLCQQCHNGIPPECVVALLGLAISAVAYVDCCSCEQEAVEKVLKELPNHAHLMGNFLDNHDLPRLWIHENTDFTMVL
jgi:hypothetical protein